MDREMVWAWGLLARDAGLDWKAIASGESGPADLLISEDPGADLVLSSALRRAWEAGGLRPGSGASATDPAELFPESGWLELPGGGQDVLGTAWYRINGLQEYPSPRLEGQWDRYGRFPFAASLEHRLGLLEDGPVAFLPDAIGTAFRALHARLFPGRDWPVQPPVLFVSHDVDRVFHGWKEDGKPALRSGRLDRFAQLATRRAVGTPEELDLASIQARNRSMGLPGAWFLLPNDTTAAMDPPDADYAWSDPRVREAFDALKGALDTEDASARLALHAPAHLPMEQALARFQATFGFKPLANRHHFLRIRLPQHYRQLDRLGLALDSSLAYAECPGFRNGYARPFHPFDVEQRRPHRVLEVPFAWMDTSFRHYLQVDADTARASGEALLEHVAGSGGVFGALFHNDYLSGIAGSHYRPVLEAFARRAQEGGFSNLDFAGLLERYGAAAQG